MGDDNSAPLAAPDIGKQLEAISGAIAELRGDVRAFGQLATTAIELSREAKSIVKAVAGNVWTDPPTILNGPLSSEIPKAPSLDRRTTGLEEKVDKLLAVHGIALGGATALSKMWRYAVSREGRKQIVQLATLLAVIYAAVAHALPSPMPRDAPALPAPALSR